jgi:hypothetical protein
MANAWNELVWGIGDYGEQNNATVSVSGVSTSTSIGTDSTITTTVDFGWSRQEWGSFAWGIQGTLLVTGQSLATSINSVTFSISAEVDVQGSSLQTNVGDTVSRIDVEAFPDGSSVSVGTNDVSLTGDALIIPDTQVTNATAGQSTIDPTFLIGSGWGRDTFGNLGWGVNYSVIGGGVNGLQANIITGDEDAFTDVLVVVTTAGSLQTAVNSVGTSANSDHEIAASLLINSVTGDVAIEGNGLVELTGVSTATAIGDAEAGLLTEVQVTGVSVTTFIGDEDITGNASVTLTGVTATGNVGDIVPVSGYDVTGSSASVVNGEVTITGSAVVAPTGTGLTVSTISPNIIAWAEVDTGTPVTWTPVDLAA